MVRPVGAPSTKEPLRHNGRVRPKNRAPCHHHAHDTTLHTDSHTWAWSARTEGAFVTYAGGKAPDFA